jgi:hypothetical protein
MKLHPILWPIVALLAISLTLDSCTPRDDSDPPGGRSGFTPRTDALTGCQYLVTPGLFGMGASITPRLDAAGKPICRRRA